MQLKFERDFFIRQAKGSDLKEAVSLVKTQHAEAPSDRIEGDFAKMLEQKDLFMKVILNSNGVLIGFLLADPARVVTIAINPNFLRKEVRDEVTKQLCLWASAHSFDHPAGKLMVPRELSANGWKAFWKNKGLKVEPAISGYEEIEFT